MIVVIQCAATKRSDAGRFRLPFSMVLKKTVDRFTGLLAQQRRMKATSTFFNKRCLLDLCVPKIRFYNIGGEVHRELGVA
jgi:hypothetical protein